MPIVNRATLPEEFFDITSANLLVQPEPQYFHALLWKMALGASFDMLGGGIGMPVPGRAFGDAGAPYGGPLEADRLALADGLYSECCVVVPEIGKAPGHTVRLNRPSYANTTYTQAAREVTSGSTISTTPIAVTSEQVPLTLKRFAGPYDQANNRVAPFGIDRFDGSVMLHRPAQVVGKNLKRDFDRTIDTIVRTLMDTVAAAQIIRPTGMTADNDSLVAGTFPMTWSLLQRTMTDMDENNIPRFANGKRVAVITPRQSEQLAQDAQFNRLAVFERDFNPLYRGTYFRSAGEWDIFKSTTLQTPTNSSTVAIHYGQALSPGCCGSGVGDMPRTAYNSQDNYGETALVVWLLYAAFGLLDQRFVRRMTTD